MDEKRLENTVAGGVCVIFLFMLGYLATLMLLAGEPFALLMLIVSTGLPITFVTVYWNTRHQDSKNQREPTKGE